MPLTTMQVRTEVAPNGQYWPAARYSMGIPAADVVRIWTTAQLQILEALRAAGVEAQVTKLHDDAAAKVHAVQQVMQQRPNLTVVSLDMYGGYGMPRPWGSVTLQVSRHYSPSGQYLGIGRRPGSPPLAKQLKALKAAMGKNPLALYEDDIATGGTLRECLALLKQWGLDIAGIFVGFSPLDGDELEGIPLWTRQRIRPGEETADMRDFFPASNGGGLVICNDHHVCEGTTAKPSQLWRAPYIGGPYGIDVSARASIPIDKVSKFSATAVETSRWAYRELGMLRGTPIAVHEAPRHFQELARIAGFRTDQPLAEFCRLLLQ